MRMRVLRSSWKMDYIPENLTQEINKQMQYKILGLKSCLNKDLAYCALKILNDNPDLFES